MQHGADVPKVHGGAHPVSSNGLHIVPSSEVEINPSLHILSAESTVAMTTQSGETQPV